MADNNGDTSSGSGCRDEHTTTTGNNSVDPNHLLHLYNNNNHHHPSTTSPRHCFQHAHEFSAEDIQHLLEGVWDHPSGEDGSTEPNVTDEHEQDQQNQQHTDHQEQANQFNLVHSITPSPAPGPALRGNGGGTATTTSNMVHSATTNNIGTTASLMTDHNNINNNKNNCIINMETDSAPSDSFTFNKRNDNNAGRSTSSATAEPNAATESHVTASAAVGTSNSDGSIASVTDGDAKALSRTERKRCREKQRRTDVNNQFAGLVAVLRKLESEEPTASEMVRLPSYSPSNRADLIARTIAVLQSMHTSNKRYKQQVETLQENLENAKKAGEEAAAKLKESLTAPQTIGPNKFMMMVPMMIGGDPNANSAASNHASGGNSSANNNNANAVAAQASMMMAPPWMSSPFMHMPTAAAAASAGGPTPPHMPWGMYPHMPWGMMPSTHAPAVMATPTPNQAPNSAQTTSVTTHQQQQQQNQQQSQQQQQAKEQPTTSNTTASNLAHCA